MKILHIEDDPLLGKILARALKRHYHGAIVVTVITPGDAITALQLDDFDIVVSDYDIMGGNGGQVLAWVKANKPRTPFVFLSGNEEAIKPLGVPYLLKPAEVADLVSLITFVTLGIVS